MKTFFQTLILIGLLPFLPIQGQAQNDFLKTIEEQLKKANGQNGSMQGSQKGENSSATSDEASSMPAEAGTYPQTETSGNSNQPPSTRSGYPSGQTWGQKEAVEAPPLPDEKFSAGTAPKGTTGKGIFGVETGTLITVTRAKHSHMNIITYDTLHFRGHGREQARKQGQDQEVNMMGFQQKQSTHTISYTNPDSIFSYKYGETTGIAMENPAKELYEGMTEAEAKRMAEQLGKSDGIRITHRGTQMYKGKQCEVTDAEMVNEQGVVTLRVRTKTYKGVTLSSVSRGMGIDQELETLSFTEGNQPNPRYFQKNKRIQYNSFGLNMWKRR